MNPKPIELAKDADLRGAPAALQRASVEAERIARQTGTRLITVESVDASKSSIHPESKVGELKRDGVQTKG